MKTFFSPVLRSAFLGLGIAAWAGCGIDADPRPLSAAHPASPEATEGSYTPPENVLQSDFPAPKNEGAPGDSPHHGHPGHSQAPATPVRPYPLKVCLVGQEDLQKMGKPVVIAYEGREIKFCCPACVVTFSKDPAKYLKLLDQAAPMERPTKKDGDSPHVHEEKK